MLNTVTVDRASPRRVAHSLHSSDETHHSETVADSRWTNVASSDDAVTSPARAMVSHRAAPSPENILVAVFVGLSLGVAASFVFLCALVLGARAYHHQIQISEALASVANASRIEARANRDRKDDDDDDDDVDVVLRTMRGVVVEHPGGETDFATSRSPVADVVERPIIVARSRRGASGGSCS